MENIILFLTICIGVIGLFLFYKNPLDIKLENERLIIKTSIKNIVGLLMFYSWMPSLMILCWIIIETERDSVVFWIFSSIIFLSYFMSIIIILTYLIYEKNRILIIDLLTLTS
jgi:hypothetical protein